ncbi:hypothetical protein [Sabulibacter ruber]|uniref:hypothetical protein n=1 Tax=Sabulibacter ruber TaxID=2811901 RepID=UPI001A969194|nr:hypothetical protein [Sabulibacter ruber]
MLTDKEQEEIRQKLLGLEEEPPLDSWSKISAQIRPARKRRPWGWLFLAALLLLVVPGGVYYVINQTPETQFSETGYKSQPDAGAETPGLDKRPAPLATTPTPSHQKDTEVAAEENSTANISQEVPTTESNTKSQLNEPEKPAGIPNTRKPGAIAFQTRSGKGKTPVLVSSRDSVTQDKPNQAKPTSERSADKVTTISIDAPVTAVPARDSVEKQTQPISPVDSAATTPQAAKDQEELPAKEATEEKTQKKTGKPWYLGVTFAPRYAFRSVKPVQEDDVYISKITSRKGLDMDRMGYEFGLNFGKQVKKNLYLETSLSLMLLRENIAYTYSNGVIDTVLQRMGNDGTIQLTPVYAIGERQLKSSYAYGGLRVGLNYFFLERPRSRFNLTLAGGMNLLVRGRTQEYLDGVWTETIIFPSKNNILEQSNYNFLIGGGYNLRVRNSFELMLMPSLNYFLGSTFKKREPIGLRPYSVGFTIQVRRHFNKS